MPTFNEIYSEALKQEKQLTPGNAFVKEIAELTCKSEGTIRTWLVKGESKRTPDKLTQVILAKHFNCTPDELFPESD